MPLGPSIIKLNADAINLDRKMDLIKHKLKKEEVGWENLTCYQPNTSRFKIFK